jgi:transcriptional regulator with PAS, ATPase and Fis domain
LFNKKYSKNVESISEPVLNCLKAYSFPGNVRELMNMINSAIIVESSNQLKKKSLPAYFWENNHIQNLSQEANDDDVPCSLSELEKEHIHHVLKFTNNNKTKAADILGISRVNLLAKIKKYHLGNEHYQIPDK